MTAHYPPSPKSALLGLDLILRFRRDPLAFGMDFAQFESDLVYYRLGPIHAYMVKHPDLIHEVLVKQAKKFHKWQRQKDVFGKFDGNGLVNSDGDFWRRQRKLIQPAFHHKRIAGYADVMVDFTKRRVEAWQPNAEFRVDQAMSHITRDIVTKTLFNADVSAETQRIGECMNVVQEMAYRDMGLPFSVPDWVPLASKRRELQAMRDLDTIITRIIRERRERGGDRGDLLSMLLLAVDEQGNGMDDRQARDEAMTLFIAGHETSATALSWTWYLLATHPEVEAKLIAEVDSVLGGRPATLADVPKLKYAEMVFKETLRLYPPTWMFPRQAVEPVEIGGYLLKPSSLVHLFPYVVHHDPRWFDQPEQFIPERFAPERADSIPDYAFFPFGGGPRVCIGNSFAMMEAQLILATVLQQYRLTLAPGQGEPEPEPLIVLRPKGGIRMRPAPREPLRQRDAVATVAV